MTIRRISEDYIKIEGDDSVEFTRLFWPENESVRLYNSDDMDIVHQLYKASALFIIDRAGKEKHEME